MRLLSSAQESLNIQDCLKAFWDLSKNVPVGLFLYFALFMQSPNRTVIQERVRDAKNRTKIIKDNVHIQNMLIHEDHWAVPALKQRFPESDHTRIRLPIWVWANSVSCIHLPSEDAVKHQVLISAARYGFSQRWAKPTNCDTKIHNQSHENLSLREFSKCQLLHVDTVNVLVLEVDSVTKINVVSIHFILKWLYFGF